MSFDIYLLGVLQLIEEVNKIAEEIKRTRPLVEQVALNIRELIQQTGRGGTGLAGLSTTTQACQHGPVCQR